jgi:hypothetical protein
LLHDYKQTKGFLINFPSNLQFSVGKYA